MTKISFDEVIVTASIEPKAGADVVCEFVMTYAAMSKGRDELGATAVPVEIIPIDIVVDDAASLQ